MAIQQQGIFYCMASQTVDNNTCLLEHIVNEADCTDFLDDSGCTGYTPPDLSECLTHWTGGYEACDEQAGTNMGLCLTTQNNGMAQDIDGDGTIDAGCTAGLEDALNDCGLMVSGLDCSNCQVSIDACFTTCHDQYGEGGGE